ncbi:MAG: alpha/beta fold hydrolase [Actinomycetes bacterium]
MDRLLGRDDIPLLPAPWPGYVVRTGTRELFVRRAPVAEQVGEPALMVHGLGGSATNWTDLMAVLRDELDCWAMDLPGFGSSPPPPGPDYSPAGHARAVIDLIEASGRGPVHLFGNSLGGVVVTLVAGWRPDLVRSLVLISPALPHLRVRRSNAHLPVLAVPRVGESLTRRLVRVPLETRVQFTVDSCFAEPSRVPQQRLDEAVSEAEARDRLPWAQEALLGSLRGLLATYFYRVGTDAPWRAAARVTAPTLLVYGLADRLVDPRSAYRAAGTFPDSLLVVVPHCGHVAQMERPDLVGGAVRRLLAVQRPR